MLETKEKIIQLLKKEEMTTSAIADKLILDYWKAVHELEDLERNNIIQRRRPKNYTIWRLK